MGKLEFLQYMSTADTAEKGILRKQGGTLTHPGSRNDSGFPLAPPLERTRSVELTMRDNPFASDAYSRKHPDSGFKKSEYR